MGTRTITTRTETRYALTPDSIRKAFDLPEDAELFVRVPGGADWSSCDLTLGVETELEVRYTRTTRTQEEVP